MKSNCTEDISSFISWKSVGYKKYLLFDLQHCSDRERIRRSGLIIPIILKEKKGSINILIDVRNTIVTIESMRSTSNDWKGALPYLNKVAISGIYGYKTVLFKLMGHLTSIKAKPFKTHEDAILFLCK